MPKIIMVVDDDLDDQQMLEDALLEIEDSLRILTFSSGQEVLKFVETTALEELPCLIVIDYNIPDIKGFEIARRLIRQVAFKDIPMVIWSTSDSRFNMKDCLSTGCRAYFVKPFARANLLEMAGQMLRYCG